MTAGADGRLHRSDSGNGLAHGCATATCICPERRYNLTRFAARSLLLATFAAGLLSSQATAQTVDTLDRRLNKLEKEVRAVQREVFPGGDERFFEPQIQTPAPGAAAEDGFGVPAATPSTVLTERVNALEAQVQALTGQVEENGYKLRQLEEQLARFTSDVQFRLQTLEGGGVAPAADGMAAAAAEGPDAEYQSAYALYTAEDFAGAQAAFATFLEQHPEHERASNAGYWLGRSLLKQDQPVQAVQAFLGNYQERRDGARAPDSLLWVGRSLMAIETSAAGAGLSGI